MRRRLLLAAGLVLGVLVAVQGRRLARAVTMESDHGAYWRRRRRSAGAVQLVALGDSLAQGIGAMRPEHSWAGRLADHVEAVTGERVQVLNLAVSGARTADVLREQVPAMPGAPTLVALAVGTNDAAADVDPETFRAELTAVCAALPAGSLVADVPDLQRDPVRAAGVGLAAVAREVVAGFPALHPVALEAATPRMRFWEAGPDLAHPSGLGYRRYGRAFAAAYDAR